MPFSVWSVSTLFSILSSLFRVYTICHSQQSVQGLHCLSFSAVRSRSTLFAFLSSLIRVYTICQSQQSDQSQGLHTHSQEPSDQDVHCLPFSAVWSRSTLFAILSSQINVCTIFHSKQFDLLKCLPFSSVWSGSTLFAILSSLIRVYTYCHSQLSDHAYISCHSQFHQGLHYLPFFLSSIIKVCTVCHS